MKQIKEMLPDEPLANTGKQWEELRPTPAQDSSNTDLS